MSIERLADLADAVACPRVVLKVGSALLMGSGGQPHREWLAGLVGEIAEARQRGQQVIVVSSGAIALGAARLGLARGGRGSLADAQAAAAVGQIALAGLWSELLGHHGLTAAQLLLTLEDLEDRRRYLNAAATLGRLLGAGAIPVINENDSVATAEIRFGDNDRLAARVAQMASADCLVLLSDVDGLYSADPNLDPSAEFFAEVHGITPRIEAMAGGSASDVGSGGMTTKIAAARIALDAGCHMCIASGHPLNPLKKVEGGARCTWFIPAATPATARKQWIAGALKPAGVLTIDAGAAGALRRGRSLLPAGVTAVTGSFERGDAVDVAGTDGRIIARGLTAYSSSDVARIMGQRSSAIEGLVGFRGRDEVVHRDDLVLRAGADD